jgi:chromosome segregation ATPase
VEGLYAKGVFDGDVNTPSEEEFKRVIYELERKKEAFEDVEIDMSFATDYADRKSELREVEKKLLHRLEKKGELEAELAELDKQKNAIEREVHAINLAINTIHEISARIREESGMSLTNIAAGKTDLEVRLNVAKQMCSDKLPLIIDDAISGCDDRQLGNMLESINAIDTEQVILMTSNQEVCDVISRLGVDYNYVVL